MKYVAKSFYESKLTSWWHNFRNAVISFKHLSKIKWQRMFLGLTQTMLILSCDNLFFHLVENPILSDNDKTHPHKIQARKSTI